MARVQLPQPLDALVPTITSTAVKMRKVGVVPGANYTLFNMHHTLPVGTYTLTYDLLASNKTHVEKRAFNDVTEIRACPHR